MERRADCRNVRRRPKDALSFNPLFVPADRPDWVGEAVLKGARTIVIDLEDGVALSNKARARSAVAGPLSDLADRAALLVRINSALADVQEDLAALRPYLSAVDGLVLSKVESSDEVLGLVDLLDSIASEREREDEPPLWIVPTVESALGVGRAYEIAAASPRVGTLLLGTTDLRAQLGVDRSTDGEELLMARSQVVMACAAAGRIKPIDGPLMNIKDEAGLLREAARSRCLGFGGKVALHPCQLEPIRNAFALDRRDIAWAREVVSAFENAARDGVGAVQLQDGSVVERPVAARARAILAEVDGCDQQSSRGEASGTY